MQSEQILEQYLEKINLPDETVRKQAVRHWDSLFKPIRGLGHLEDMIADIAAISGTEKVEISKKAIVVMCSDNGVVSEQVTQSNQEMTAIVAGNLSAGKASVNRMASFASADVVTIDIGIAKDLNLNGLRNRKLAYGTGNIKKEAAMTREQAVNGILIGIETVKGLKEQGYQLIGTGEMGIGNTTTSSAIASVLLECPAEVVTGKGAGLDKEGLNRKCRVIKEAVQLNKPDHKDVLDVLSKVGGFDIAGLTGIFLGGAVYHIPIVLDGVITQAAALIAKQLSPDSAAYMFASHQGKEPASRLLLDRLGLKAPICAELALGEGTGAVLLFPMLDMAVEVYKKSSTFLEQKVKAYEKYEEIL